MSCHCQSSLDLGTPASSSTECVSFTIDGQAVSAPVGTTIIRAAAEAGIKIPKLCATEQLNAFGSCRLCLVQVEGRRGYPASCTTPVEAGMKIVTQSQKLADLRKGVMELYISDHPLDCLTCTANGNCELQDMAGVVGLREVRYGMAGENHFDAQHAEPKDESNPYFSFEPSKCIVCSRCVRACEEVQGTFALTIGGRGFDSKVVAGANESFLGSECVSCGACVNACPTATLSEKNLIQMGQAERSVTTTCAYCGVGCSFKAEVKGQQVVRMVPDKNGGANAGHACVKGRFAWGYATHPDRVTQPMIRKSIHDAWQAVSWEEAVNYAASEFKRIQAQYGRKSVGGITSSRCTNEETYLVQKLVRTAFGNNNVDTCARVCHSPTGYGLKQTLGESAGTQDFESVMHADVIIVMGANPTEGHPVFGSLLKKRLRQGVKLIVIDPREIEIVRTPHIEAAYHLPLKPGTNVAMINALAHVVVTEGLLDEDFVRTRCEQPAFAQWREFILRPENSPESVSEITGVSAEAIRGAARLYASAPNGAIYYGLGVTEHSQGSTTVMGIANLAMLTGNIGRAGVGVNPLRGQNNVQGSCDMGSFPHELPGYRHVSIDAVRNEFSRHWNVELDPEPGYRIPNMMNAAVAGTFKGMYIQGEDIAQSDPNTKHIQAALESLECLVIQDIFFNETAKYAHVFLPGASFLEKDGTFTNAERRISRIRKVMEPLGGKADWEGTMLLANALGVPMNYQHPAEIMAEIAALTPSFTGVSYEKLDKHGSLQWPCNDEHPEGYKIMHTETFTRGLGQFILTEYVPTTEKITARFPLILTTGRILSQYNVGAQTRRTKNVVWHAEDKLEIHMQDAEDRGIQEGDWVLIASRAGETRMRVEISNRVQPGVVYTTFHFPESGANVVTTDNSDWATNCPEYKVTAVQVSRCEDVTVWQQEFAQMEAEQQALLP
ncbi:formate dehydrogenase subunit alpha [uncultured Thiothrix sp.]|uniref:formate dehydrogenase subunit alpha n=1 Tax=uncultured Thiothrix sp. TaxID=223185 RepID=UPI0026119704|nr:formate dehydrogenase subunit alpha [uncultured Thiothrix sp.]HMT93097.1 formate dehydrogenase subunit alpha [Thiolinea sp.]